MLSLKEELLLGRANIHLACSLSSLYPFYCCCCNCLCMQFAMSFLSLSPPSSLARIQWNHKKRVKETKITIHHRTKKKNKGFLTNNNDRHVTNMNSFFSLSRFFLFLFILYYIRILKRRRIAIRLYCFLKCIDKYIQKMHEIGNACGTVQDCILDITIIFLLLFSPFLSLSLFSRHSTLHSIT